LLNQGKLIGFPTETVYGLAADARNDLAVALIFDAKKRPSFNPLIIHSSTTDAFKAQVEWNERADKLANAFWPGPLTLVLPRLPSASVSLLASAGLDTLAIRIPNHPIALEILSKFNGLIAAPSANTSGTISPTESQHVIEAFPDLFVLEGGQSTIGLESTIVDLTGPSPVLLRPGVITEKEIEKVIGFIVHPSTAQIKAPGMMKSHYCPNTPLRLNALQREANEAYLGYGSNPYSDEHSLNLSPEGNLREAAANLFKMLRKLDKPIYSRIAVAPIPFEGIGLALNDRLTRAAAPRES
jgi:L-threonylcarbamoyladenylate synthase